MRAEEASLCFWGGCLLFRWKIAVKVERLNRTDYMLVVGQIKPTYEFKPTYVLVASNHSSPKPGSLQLLRDISSLLRWSNTQCFVSKRISKYCSFPNRTRAQPGDGSSFRSLAIPPLPFFSARRFGIVKGIGGPVLVYVFLFSRFSKFLYRYYGGVDVDGASRNKVFELMPLLIEGVADVIEILCSLSC
jgi:hypothetical protein